MIPFFSDIIDIKKEGKLGVFELPFKQKRINNNLYEEYVFKKKPLLYKSTWKKSKLPDLKKLGIIDYRKGYKKLKITYLGNQLIKHKANQNKNEYEKLLCELIGRYSFQGFRPYAFFVKVLYTTFGVEIIENKMLSKILSCPIDKTLLSYSLKKKELFKTKIIKEAKRPSSYMKNYLFKSGLGKKIDNSSFQLNSVCQNFIKMYFDDEALNLDELEASPSTNTRPGQAAFREKVLEANNYRCAVTGSSLKYKDKHRLEAAHIYPVCAGGSDEITNGMPLLQHIHKLFDQGAFTIIPDNNKNDYNIEVTESLVHNGVFPPSMKVSNLPNKKKYYPSPLSLKNHKDFVFKKGVNKYCSELNNN